MTITKGKQKIYTADSLARYIEKLSYLNDNPNRLFFRGLSKYNYKLVPSLGRIIKEGERKKWIEKESRLVEFAEQRFPDSFIKATPSLILANMQHYGIPTRMMDITGNALVALYFACLDEKFDGKVIVFCGDAMSAYNPYVNIIADTYRLINNTPTYDDEYYYIISKQEYAFPLFSKEWQDSDKIKKILNPIEKPLIIDVGAVNQRQINQNGKFIIFPNCCIEYKNGRKKIINELVDIDKDWSDMIIAKIRIPKESKPNIMKKLQLVGITKEFLFPDDTSKICDSIKTAISLEEGF